MHTKLTLALDEEVIQQAKKYAKRRHISLSKLVEYYFISLIQNKNVAKNKLPISPITEKLSGMIKVDMKNYKKILKDALLEKYL